MILTSFTCRVNERVYPYKNRYLQNIFVSPIEKSIMQEKLETWLKEQKIDISGVQLKSSSEQLKPKTNEQQNDT